MWGSLVGGVLIATLIRWAIGGLVHDRIPFTTYYPAILVATLLGGFWRGTLASALSAVVAWWLFMSPSFGSALDQAQLVSLPLFSSASCWLVQSLHLTLSSIIFLSKSISDARRTSVLDNSHRW